MKVLSHDKSPCRWSVQVNGHCPYNEFINMIYNDLSEEKRRCKNKQCLNILIDKYGSERNMVNALNPKYLKPEGPANSTNILNNYNIDDTIKDFSLASLKSPTPFKNGPFFHIPFDMYDFMKEYNSVLRNLDFATIKDYNTFGCVLNTDIWSGPGDHWVCIFGVINHNTRCVNVEYFNSSGNGLEMYPGLNDWAQMNREYKVKIRPVIHCELQQSETECGMWCIYYIKLRLEGHKPQYMITQGITDDNIIAARKYIFS